MGTQRGGPPPAPPALLRAAQCRQRHLQGKTLSVGQKGEKKRGLQITYLRRRLCRALFSQDKGRGPWTVTARSPQRRPSRGLPVLKFRVWSKTALQGGEEGTLSTPSAGGFSIQLSAASICIRAGPFLPRNNAAPLFPAHPPFWLIQCYAFLHKSSQDSFEGI